MISPVVAAAFFAILPHISHAILDGQDIEWNREAYLVKVGEGDNVLP